MIRIAINGFGRIGRNIVRALYLSGYRDLVQVVAINDLGDANTCAHLLEYDSVHGHFNAAISVQGGKLHINNDSIQLLSEPDPSKLPWGKLNVDVVMECSGRMTSGHKAEGHLSAGAKKVLLSAPSDDAEATIVYGVNEHVLENSHTIISNASCTTNCLAPMAKVLHEEFGIEDGNMTTIHAYTNDQHLLDLAHDDLYRARAAALSMIPTKTGAAKAIGKVLPGLDGKIHGMAVRVPTANVSLVDLVLHVDHATTRDEVNAVMKKAAQKMSVLAYNDKPLVSVDFNGHSASCIFDANHTMASGQLVHVMAWYDNEWGFCHRMLDTALAMMSV